MGAGESLALGAGLTAWGLFAARAGYLYVARKGYAAAALQKNRDRLVGQPGFKGMSPNVSGLHVALSRAFALFIGICGVGSLVIGVGELVHAVVLSL